MIFSLERRLLLSDPQPLHMICGDGDDTVGLERDGDQITVSINLDPLVLSASDVSEIHLELRGGDDVLDVRGRMDLPVTIDGGDGNDLIDVGTDATVSGDDGNDTIRALAGAWCMIDGGAGRDFLYGSDNSFVTLRGGAGQDYLISENLGADFVDFSDFTEPVYVRLGINANSAGDVMLGHFTGVIGGAGNDTLVGDDSMNDLFGNGGDDVLLGQGSGDYLVGGPGSDDIAGGAERDTVSYLRRTDDLQISLDDTDNDGAPGEHDNVHSDIETVLSGSGNDRIVGSIIANELDGGAGADTIIGNRGRDTLWADDAGDQVFGGAGNDRINLLREVDATMDGGAGNDLVVRNTARDSTRLTRFYGIEKWSGDDFDFKYYSND